MTEGNIILLHEVIASKARKEQELVYYQQKLDDLVFKMSVLKQDIDLTNKIIDILETEKVIDITTITSKGE